MRYSKFKPETYTFLVIHRVQDRSGYNFGGIELCGPSLVRKSWTAQSFGGSVTHCG